MNVFQSTSSKCFNLIFFFSSDSRVSPKPEVSGAGSLLPSLSPGDQGCANWMTQVEPVSMRTHQSHQLK